MKRVALVIALCASAGLAHAQATWTDTAETSSYKFSIKDGSFAVTKDKSGEPVAVVTGRSETKLTRTVNVEKWYVRLADCGREEGKLVATDISGKYLYDNDFVFGAGSVASRHAETICAVYKYLTTQSNKGL